MNLKSLIRDIPDFPKKGILFRDVSPLLRDPKALEFVTTALGAKFQLDQIDYFAGIESRGFIFASLLSSHFKKGFIPIRKAGKLPPPVVAKSYSLEYGSATLELAPGVGRVAVLDDVLATGGTLQAAIELCEQAGYKVEDVAVLIDLPFLNQMKFKNKKINSLVQY